MDVIGSLIGGFAVVLAPENLLAAFLGALMGTIVGVLPGLGPSAAIALLLPVTMGMSAVAGIIMLAGIYYGAMYGGSTTSILVNIPGEASSVITCIDGYQMALQGRAGPALGISAIGSFIGGTFGIVVVMLVSPQIAGTAVLFGPPERFALLFLAFILIGFMTATEDMARGLLMGMVGLLLGVVGTDNITGVDRFTFGTLYLRDGFSIAPIAMGVFGLGEILYNIEQRAQQGSIMKTPKDLLPSLQDFRNSLAPIGRGSLIGFGIGVLPGGIPTIASIISYIVEKRLAKHPESFGKGAIEGVAGPETANNAATAGGFVPLLTLGIPTNTSTALMLAALMFHGVSPGPLLIFQHPEVFWGVIASMYIGNIMLIILNLPLIGLFVQLLKVPYTILSPMIIMFVLLGSYTINGSAIDVFVTGLFGILGYLLKRFKFPVAPLILAFILGQMMESSFRQALIMSPDGSISIFFTRMISGPIMILAIVVLFFPFVLKRVRNIFAKGGSSATQ